MDLDAFSAMRSERWARLAALARKRSLSGAEADELARLYQSTAADLSELRSSAPDPATIARLSVTLATARGVLARGHRPIWREVAEYIVYGFPAALYRLRWVTVGVMVGFLLVAVSSALYTVAHPDLAGAAELRQQLAEENFSNYYVEDSSGAFFSGVWTNNARVALFSVGGGYTGVVPFIVQYDNAAWTGTVAGIMAEHHLLPEFFKLILPHGLIELTAVWVAGAAGLRMFWSLAVPGPRPRLRALAEEGRSAVGVALGLVVVLLIAGLIEGYVTGSILPWLLQDAIGVAVLTAFWLYVLIPGRRAAASGFTGDVSRDNREDYAPTAG